jgi:hypothetical protein
MNKRQSRLLSTQQKQTPAFSRKSIFIFGFITFLCIGIFILIMELPGLRITTITTSGETNISKETLDETISRFVDAKKKLRITYLHNFTFPRKKITEHLYEKFPRIKNIETTYINNTMILSIEEHEPDMVVCQQDSETCFYATKDGYVFDRAFIESINNDVIYKTYQSLQNDIWIHDVDTLSTIQSILEIWTNDGLHIQSIVLDENTIDIMYQVSKRNGETLAQPFSIKTSQKQSKEETISLVQKTLEDIEVKRRLDKGDLLEYIDVRFSNKILYRFYGDI